MVVTGNLGAALYTMLLTDYVCHYVNIYRAPPRIPIFIVILLMYCEPRLNARYTGLYPAPALPLALAPLHCPRLLSQSLCQTIIVCVSLDCCVCGPMDQPPTTHYYIGVFNLLERHLPHNVVTMCPHVVCHCGQVVDGGLRQCITGDPNLPFP